MTACEKKQVAQAPVNPPGTTVTVGVAERGEASWYGEPYHGRRAASGEIYDMEELTAAHRTLPFQTWVEVTNLLNGKKVDVRITDRGPFVDGRIIDLSRAAAREIDLLRAGIAPVELRVIEPPEPADRKPALVASNEVTTSESSEPAAVPSSTAQTVALTPAPGPRVSVPASRTPSPQPTLTAGYAVQAGAFRDRDRADALAASLLLSGARVVAGEPGSGLWRVWVGNGLDLDAATALLRELQAVVKSAFIVRELGQ